MASVQSIREVEILNLDCVSAGGYPREEIPVLTDGGEGRIVLDPAQYVRYTGGVQCGTRSHERSGLQWTRDSVRSRRHPVRAESVTTCAKPPEKSKGSTNQASKPDQAKVGRVNESESLSTRRKSNRSSKYPG